MSPCLADETTPEAPQADRRLRAIRTDRLAARTCCICSPYQRTWRESLSMHALQGEKSIRFRDTLHPARVARPAPALRRDPVDVLGWVLDVTGFAVHAIL